MTDYASVSRNSLVCSIATRWLTSVHSQAPPRRRIYDMAQDRGEVATNGKPVNVPGKNIKATTADIALSRKDIHEARQIRDAELADPGIVRRTIDNEERKRWKRWIFLSGLS